MYQRFKNRRKFLLGRRYEGYVTWLLRKDGWHVQERGHYKFDDGGVDLIATKNGVTRYIQCKGWKKSSPIHLNTVTQLYGSVVALHGSADVEMFIYSPCAPDAQAQDKAHALHVQFQQTNYPKWMWSRRYRRLASRH